MADVFYRFAVAFGIGLLIGLERQFHKTDGSEKSLFAGVRTFPLLALTGCGAAMLGDLQQSPWGLVLPFVVAGALLTVSYARTSSSGDLGMTTEVAAVLTLLIGALCYHGQLAVSAALGVATLGLLSLKIELHRFSRTLTSEEIVSLAMFGLMTAIVLPVLPARSLLPAPFDVLTLRNVWLMVILVSAIGLAGYILKKLIGGGKAIAWTGLLGGLVSSTAVTLSYAARSKVRPELSTAFAIAVIIAWTTMFLRVIVEVAIVNPALVNQVWIPMTAAAVVGSAYCLVLWRRESKAKAGGEDVEVERPFSLRKSLIWGGLYAVVLVVARSAQMYFGDQGIYASGIVAGMTDVDAITLSMAELSRAGGSVEHDVAARAITLAAVSNTLIKTIIVLLTADAKLKRSILPGVAAIVAAALGGSFLF